MEWDKQQLAEGDEEFIMGDYVDSGILFVERMTDQQMEMLQKQIAAYMAISEQLVELHKTRTIHDELTGVRIGNMFYNSALAFAAHKISGRQRWTPTHTQLEILENTFKQQGSISKAKIPELRAKLQLHGQVSDTNIYNWFQNRRARSKRKLKVITSSSRGNNEVEEEVEIESSKNKVKVQNFEGRSNVLRKSEARASLANEGSSSIHGGFEHTPFHDME